MLADWPSLDNFHWPPTMEETVDREGRSRRKKALMRAVAYNSGWTEVVLNPTKA
jgi:hypothetical protein